MNPEAFAASIREYIDSAIELAVAEAVKDLRGKDGAPGDRGEPGPAGPQGEKGADGAPGKDGAPGVGIADIAVKDGALLVTLTDGAVKDLGSVKGERGADGAAGKDGRDGVDGKDAVVDTEDIEACVAKALPDLVSEAVKALPPAPKGDPGRDGIDGKDGADGRDGKDGEPGKDGVGISALDIKEGNLIVTLTNGSEKMLGRIVGRDGKDGRDGERGEKGDAGPSGPQGERGERGEKGADGITKDHLDLILDLKIDALGKSIRADGEVVKMGDRELYRIPGIRDKGVWSEGTAYMQGDAVSFGGSLWVCQKDNAKGKPGVPPNEDWRLAVKKGRDGKDRTKE